MQVYNTAKGGAYKMILLNADISGSALLGLFLVYGIFGIILLGSFAVVVYYLIKAKQKQNKKQ